MKRTAQQKKEALIKEYLDTRFNLLEAAQLMTESQTNEIFLGIWTVKDLLAHLIGWDFTNIKAISEVLDGKLPGFYQYRDRDWQKYNAILVNQYHSGNFDELISSVKKSSQELIEAIESVPAQEIEKDKGVRYKGYKVLISRLIKSEINDEKVHYLQIMEYQDRANRGNHS